MKTLKTGIACILGMIILVVGYFGVNSWWHQDYVRVLFYLGVIVFLVGLIVVICLEPHAAKQQELLFKQKCLAIEWITEHKKGSKKEFCQRYGTEIYNLFLDKGYIHEPLDGNPKNVCWEATHLAFITNLKIKKEGIL